MKSQQLTEYNLSIFGWEHFIGYRDLQPGECMVQFLKDPVFNTSLIVGYYWIPLCVLVVLYANIFHAAWTLSQKSREKEKGRYFYDVRKTFGNWNPPCPSCAYLVPLYTKKFMQPSLLHILFGYPSSLSVQTSYKYCPEGEGEAAGPLQEAPGASGCLQPGRRHRGRGRHDVSGPGRQSGGGRRRRSGRGGRQRGRFFFGGQAGAEFKTQKVS